MLRDGVEKEVTAKYKLVIILTINLNVTAGNLGDIFGSSNSGTFNF